MYPQLKGKYTPKSKLPKLIERYPRFIGNFYLSHKISIYLGLSNFGLSLPILCRHNFSHFKENIFSGKYFWGSVSIFWGA